MMPKEESKKQLITRATQYGVDPKLIRSSTIIQLSPLRPRPRLRSEAQTSKRCDNESY